MHGPPPPDDPEPPWPEHRGPAAYRRMMVVLEERPGSQAALAEALAMAQEHGAELLLAQVPPRDLLSLGHAMTVAELNGDPVRAELRDAAQARADSALARARDAGIPARSLILDAADPAPELASAAREHGCDVIVVACDGRNAVLRLLSGSLVPGLITESTVPVLVCRDRRPGPAARRPRRRRRRRDDPAPANTAAPVQYTRSP